MTPHIDNLTRLFKENKFKELEKQSKLLIKNSCLNISEENFKIYLFYALSLFKINNVKKSIDVFQRLLNFKIDFEAYFHLGNCYLTISKFEKSRSCFKKCIEINPKFIDSYIQYLKTYSLDHFDIFEEEITKILNQFPTNERLLFEVGNIYYELNEPLKAEAIYEKLLQNEKNINNVLVLLRLAACREIRLDVDEAIKINEKILKIEPDLIDARLNLVSLYRSTNQKEKALNLLSQILIDNPYNFEARRQYSIIHKFKKGDEKNLKFLLELEGKEFFKKADDHSKILYYFSISKALEDIKEYKLSSINLKKGNNLRRKKISYNEELTFKQFEEIKKFSIKKNIEKLSLENNTNQPIFIIGMPRSGTTLVEQIISSHSKVFGAGELFFFQRLIKRYFPEVIPEKFTENLVHDMPKYSKIIHDEYLLSINSLKFTKNVKFITDKNPFNFIFTSLIKIVFPKSKIIYCSRNPKDNCLSIFKNFFPMSGIGFAYDEEELKNYYLEHKRLMQYYLQIFGSEIYTVQYENLISNSVSEVKSILNYLELPWENSCLEFYKNKNVVKTLSTTQVRSKISNESIESWKKYSQFIPKLFEGI